MLISFFAGLALIAFGTIILQFLAAYRQVSASVESPAPVNSAARYQPMLRLLSEDDFSFLAHQKKLADRVRKQRVQLFRGYLRCLTRDYARLLTGIRLAMVQSAVDRPDLARALAINKFRFAVALCRIELRLRLHTAGVGNVDVSGLVEAVDGLRTQVGYLSPLALPAL